MSELLPCPFCGGEAEVHPSSDWNTRFSGKTFFVWCDKCETRGDYYDTEAEAIAAWNTRHHFGLTDEDYNILLDEMGVSERTCRNNDTDNDDFFQCSECGSSSVTEFLRGGYGLPNYCPNCGARVIGEDV